MTSVTKKEECLWCGDTRVRLNLNTMKMNTCNHCKRMKGFGKQVVVSRPALSDEELFAKYADRVRHGKTMRDKSRKEKRVASESEI